MDLVYQNFKTHGTLIQSLQKKIFNYFLLLRQHFEFSTHLASNKVDVKIEHVSEEDLIRGAIQEDKLSQKKLYYRHAAIMLNVCRRYARHDSEAEDIMQDGFIKVFDNISKFNFEGSFQGWVRRIMVNSALMNVRKSSFKNEQFGIEGLDREHDDVNAISAMSEKELLAMIDSLPQGYKIVFNLYAIEGYSHKEIAELLKIKEATSRSQLIKARRMLQEMVNKSQ